MQHFEQFLKHKEYLEGVSPRTIKYFRFCLLSWKKIMGPSDALPTQQNLNSYVIGLRESGISLATINSYIRGLNSFLAWLHTSGHTSEPLKMKPFRQPQKVLETFTTQHIKRLVSFRPKTFHEHRIHAMVLVALDTGCRIDELITLRWKKVNLSDLFITVTGKGNKERVVPISLECRKVLYKFRMKHDFDFVFPTRHGGKVYYRSALAQFKKMCKKVGVTGVRCSFHTLRHTFATSYIQNGGNVFYLQRLLGHTDIATTRIYVNAGLEDLQLVHAKTSILENIH